MTIGTAALPKAYRDLASPAAPRLIREAVALFGTTEVQGRADNPEIMAWAREAAAAGAAVKGYYADSVPWCGLFACIVAIRAGWRDQIPATPLWALSWLEFGQPVDQPGLGDVLVFRRPGGGHVGFYVGEDATHFHVLGGNQGDRVSIIRLPKKLAPKGIGFRGARRPKWRIAQPASVRPIQRSARGVVAGGSLA